MNDQNADISRLLRRAREEGGRIPEDLLGVVYARLRAVAANLMNKEQPGHTLQPTILVHEAWMRLAAQERAEWKNRDQFFAVAARMMRRLLVNHARDRLAQKRGDGRERQALDSVVASFEQRSIDVTLVDDCLGRLHTIDPEASEVVEMRFFGGMNLADIARERGSSESTVRRAWMRARTWLRREMGDEVTRD